MALKRTPPVAILGAGLAGLTAANWLQNKGVPVVVYEAGKQIAGLASTFQEDGFTYDFGAHFITNRLAKEIGVSDRCRDVAYYGESVYLNGRNYGYPFGLLGTPRFLAGGLATLSPGSPRPAGALSLQDRFCALYGDALAREVAIPLAEAWSGASASELAPSVADKIPSSLASTIFLKILGRIQGRAIAIGYGKEKPNSAKVWHVYPEGGLSRLCHRLAEPILQSVRLESPVESILVDNGRAVAVRVKGEIHPAAAVISTAPCNVLPKLIQGTDKLNFLARFRFRPMLFVLMRLRGRGVLKDTVVWTPEKEFPFFRLTEAPISMPWLAPEGKTLLTIDLGCERNDSIWNQTEDELQRMCLEKLERIIPDVKQRFLGVRVLRTPYAYPIFLREYEADRLRFRQGTGIESLYSIGRNGEFDHLLTEDVYWRTLRKMAEVLPTLNVSERFNSKLSEESKYQERTA